MVVNGILFGVMSPYFLTVERSFMGRPIDPSLSYFAGVQSFCSRMVEEMWWNYLDSIPH